MRKPVSTRAVGLSLLMAGLCGCTTHPPRTDATVNGVPNPAEAKTRALIQDLSSSDRAVRSRSAWALAGATELEGEARHALEPLQSDSERTVRYAAVWALSHLRMGNDEPDPPRAAAGNWTPPKPVASPRPSYPVEARAAQVQGTVLVEILVGEEGEVAHLQIRQSIPELNAAALTCVAQWKFEPARVDGVPRAAVAYVPVAFRAE